MRLASCLLAPSLLLGAALLTAAAPAMAGQVPAVTAKVRARMLAERVTGHCGSSDYTVVPSSDGTSISVLFDNFTASTPGNPWVSCPVRIPLNLPAGYSMGVYRMDYRGFVHAETGGARVAIDYGFGKAEPRRHVKALDRSIDGDFSFTDTVPAGQMRRAGCGANAVLDLTTTLMLPRDRDPGVSQLTLDSIDGNSGGVTFLVDLKPCKK